MSAVVNNKLLLYADDSAILVTGKDRLQIEKELSKELQSVSEWLVDNKLSLHLGKTESILFGSKIRLKKGSSLNISCNGTDIKSTSSVKYLGALLDNSLSCDEMVNSVIQKVNSRLKFLYRKRNFLNEHTKKLLVSSLIQCHFDYACSFWFHCLTNKLKNKLQVTQNKMIRFVLSLEQISHISKNHFKDLNWLPVQKRVDQITLCHVFKIKHGLAPDYMSEHFVSQDSVHSHNTRFSKSGCFSVPKVKSHGFKSFSYNGCKLWNQLPSDIRAITNLSHFKNSIKQHYLSVI